MNRRWNTQGQPYMLGVEEELMLVNADGQLVDMACQILSGVDDQHVHHELMQCMIEVTTPPVPVHAVQSAIQEMRSKAQRLAHAHGCQIASLATHPLARGHDHPLTPQPRYHNLLKQHPQLRDLLVFGLHIHVCIPHPQRALRVQQVLSALAPDLMALAASSPFVEGQDSGLATARADHLLTLPRTGPSPRWESWNGYSSFMQQMIDSGEIQDETFVWHDVRLQPRYGTVEVRVFDSQEHWQHSSALAVLVHHLAKEIDADRLRINYKPEVTSARRKLAVKGELVLQEAFVQAINDLSDPHRTNLQQLMHEPGYIKQRKMGPESVARALGAQNCT